MGMCTVLAEIFCTTLSALFLLVGTDGFILKLHVGLLP